MRRLIAFGAVAGLAAFVLAQVSGTDMLAGFAKALNSAKSLSTTYTVQRIGGGSANYSLNLSKPNKARIDTPTQLVVADGTNITTLDKKDNSYYKKPQTDADLKDLFKADDLSLFGPFFDSGFYSGKVVSSKAAGQKVLRGVSYNVVLANMDDKGKKTTSFYLDPADQLAKVGQFVSNDTSAGVTDTLLVITKTYAIDGAQKGELYAFTAPDGSREVSLEEMNSGKWFESLAEAQAMSKKTGKPMFVDFYADW